MISYRAVAPTELDRVTAWVVSEPVGWIPADRYLAELADHMYRPEWTWIAETGGRMVGRALWWGPKDSAHPVALDCLDVDPGLEKRAEVAAELIRAALAGFPKPVQYAIKAAGGWRDDPVVSAAVEWRRAAGHAAGLTQEVERLQFEWTPGDGVPTAVAGGLRFEQASDEEFLAVFARIAEGSLDAQTRASLTTKGVEATARAEMDFYLGAPGKREWWRIARTPEGDVAGMAIPSATPYSVNVGYLGVVPELRGRGLVDELLGEITRIHVTNGAARITATTDVGNGPMAAAFRRAGYRNTEIRINLSNEFAA
ncbi:GNAT family N-acetyltransferase [Nonomuraea sp. PA05]|uniref:GNAT family N-acetyltransferase n=1 Tax=Nonomuraea sp. PA05 TaxID=2604466 RepID=UPI0011DAE886|nr:GNAT family N-acetyltransferase [Nonomuraea sp. PA05]TYB69569.1 GNAT family N-acetyltransferase [Nonomuraea sp. PA05]